MENHDTKHNALQVVLKAGTILVSSGAEIFRAEQTMGYIAKALGLKDFDAYVISNGIMASASNSEGNQEAVIRNIQVQEINLGKLEAINTLSRSLVHEDNPSPKSVYDRLKSIETMVDYGLLAILTAYFVGAGAFSLALGSSIGDAMAAALTGLFVGMVYQFISKYIYTGFLLTILGSTVATLSVNLLNYVGLGEHRSLILLGALIVLVPGATFVSSVREFSQNNFSTGLALLMSALLVCISISVGVVITTEALPFAERLTQTFSDNTGNMSNLLLRVVMAGLGTVAFSVLYHVPKRYFFDLGLLGSLSWLLYLLITRHLEIEALAIFIPGITSAFLSRLLAAKRKCPATIFLSTSMVPLIPGLSLYRAIYFLLTGADQQAMIYLRSCFITAFTIALAISLVQQIPLDFFRRYFKR